MDSPHTEYIKELEKSRLSRLKLFYDNLKNYDEFKDFNVNGIEYRVPRRVPHSKNIYVKYLKFPMNFSKRKRYVYKLYNDYYELYRNDNNFYFIDTDCYNDLEREYAFGNSVVFSYIAMSIFECLKWLVDEKSFHVKIIDEVFNPIFEIPQYNSCIGSEFRISMYPIRENNNGIKLSIFK